jgi:hypothetical protein
MASVISGSELHPRKHDLSLFTGLTTSSDEKAENVAYAYFFSGVMVGRAILRYDVKARRITILSLAADHPRYFAAIVHGILQAYRKGAQVSYKALPDQTLPLSFLGFRLTNGSLAMTIPPKALQHWDAILESGSADVLHTQLQTLSAQKEEHPFFTLYYYIKPKSSEIIIVHIMGNKGLAIERAYQLSRDLCTQLNQQLGYEDFSACVRIRTVKRDLSVYKDWGFEEKPTRLHPDFQYPQVVIELTLSKATFPLWEESLQTEQKNAVFQKINPSLVVVEEPEAKTFPVPKKAAQPLPSYITVHEAERCLAISKLKLPQLKEHVSSLFREWQKRGSEWYMRIGVLPGEVLAVTDLGFIPEPKTPDADSISAVEAKEPSFEREWYILDKEAIPHWNTICGKPSDKAKSRAYEALKNLFKSVVSSASSALRSAQYELFAPAVGNFQQLPTKKSDELQEAYIGPDGKKAGLLHMKFQGKEAEILQIILTKSYAEGMIQRAISQCLFRGCSSIFYKAPLISTDLLNAQDGKIGRLIMHGFVPASASDPRNENLLETGQWEQFCLEQGMKIEEDKSLKLEFNLEIFKIWRIYFRSKTTPSEREELLKQIFREGENVLQFLQGVFQNPEGLIGLLKMLEKH